MRELWATLFLAGASALAACATIGEPFEPRFVAQIKHGEHDKAQIRTWFGEPHQQSTAMAHESQGGCEERWHYAYAQATPGGRTQSDVLMVSFDEAGRVCDIAHTKIR